MYAENLNQKLKSDGRTIRNVDDDEEADGEGNELEFQLQMLLHTKS